MTTGALRSCAHGGGADAPLCTLALARRASPAETDEVDLLLASRDPIIRAHAAAGLAGSEDPTRGGRLAAAYTYEPDPLVRSAIIDALAAVPRDAPSVADTVALAARLDPDPAIRWSAAHLPAVRSPALKRDDGDIASIHLVEPTGAPPPREKPAPSSAPTASQSQSSSTPTATPWSPASRPGPRVSSLRLALGRSC